MSGPDEGLVGGVDGCPGGWMLAVVSARSHGRRRPGPFVLTRHTDFAELVAHARQQQLLALGVDMPIGLGGSEPRSAEGLARKRLGSRSSTLFPTPCHSVLHTSTYAEANATNRVVFGKGLSKQAFHLLPKIREVRSAINPTDQPWISEVHPESSFTEMAGRPLAPKSSGQGVAQRLALLRQQVGTLPDLHALPDGQYSIDDALDAAAAAWTARRIAAGTAHVLGPAHTTDPDGYALTISI